jgi:hypothetical protein
VTALICLGGFADASWATPGVDVSFGSCQQQLQALLRTDLDCVVELRPRALTDIPQTLQDILRGVACSIPVQFKKSQVYGEWITDHSAHSPDFSIDCKLTNGGQGSHFSALARVECDRSNGVWSCFPTLHDVAGLGVLGRVLENYVNNSAQLRTALTSALAPP